MLVWRGVVRSWLMAVSAALGEPCTGPAAVGGCGVNGCPGIPGICPGTPGICPGPPGACPGMPLCPAGGVVGTNCPFESIWNPGGTPGIPPGSPPSDGLADDRSSCTLGVANLAGHLPRYLSGHLLTARLSNGSQRDGRKSAGLIHCPRLQSDGWKRTLPLPRPLLRQKRDGRKRCVYRLCQ